MFADRIKELRGSRKLTQREFAERAGISPTTLISYEKGGKTPSYDVLVKLANEFNVSLDWLCEIERKEEDRVKTLSDFIQMLVPIIKKWGIGESVELMYDSEDVGAYGKRLTYRDVLSIRFKSDLRCYFEEGETHEEDLFYNDPQLEEHNEGYFYRPFMQALSELENMEKLTRNGVIPRDIFDLWVERKCAEYSNIGLRGEHLPEKDDSNADD